MSRFKKTGLFMALLCSAIVVLYGQFLNNQIVFDDLPFFMLDNDGQQPVSTYHFSLTELRSLPYATLAWTKAMFGLDLVNFRVGNLLLHTAVVLALFFFLSSLLTALSDASDPERLTPQVTAFFAALLFALHPVATYAVGYLVQRTIIMATLFSLLSMLAYVQGNRHQKPVWAWLSVVFYDLAVFSKEHAIMLPFALVALTVLLHEDWRVKLTRQWAIFAAYAGIAMLVVLIRKGVLGSLYEPNASDMLIGVNLAYPLSVLTQAWLFFKYAFLWLFPNPVWMSIDMREPFAPALLSTYLIAMVAFLGWGAIALWLLTRRGMTGLAGFAMLFPWLMFMTEFSSVRIQEVFVLYRSYLWAVGAFCWLPVMLMKANGRMAAFVLSILALAMLPVSMDRLMTLSHPVLLWDDAEKLVKDRPGIPGAYRIYYNRGTEYIKIDRPDAAIADLKQSIAVSKDFAEAYGNLGAAYINKADWANAQSAFSRAIQIELDDKARTGQPISPKYFQGRAQAYEGLGELEKAQADYRLSCQLGNRGCDKRVVKKQEGS